MGDFRFVMTASDYDASVEFFTEKLELPIVHSWDDHGRGTIVQAADGQIEIFGHQGEGSPQPVSGAIIAFEIDDANARYDQLQTKGVTLLSEPADQPYGHRNFMVEAPDGLVITMFEVLWPEA